MVALISVWFSLVLVKNTWYSIIVVMDNIFELLTMGVAKSVIHI